MEDKTHILIVDDEKSAREIFSKVLKPYSEFHVDTAIDGKEALKKIKKNTP